MNKNLCLNAASTFPEFAGIPRERFVKGNQVLEPEFLQPDGMQDLIFAPDPHTGVPRSDLAMILSKDARPEVSQYIRDTLMAPLPSSSRLVDPDQAIEVTKNCREDLISYGNRLREIAQKYAPKPNDENK